MSASDLHVDFCNSRLGHDYLQRESSEANVTGSGGSFVLKGRRYHLSKITLPWPRDQVHEGPAKHSRGRQGS